VAPQRDEIFKQKVNDCDQHIILQKSTNFHTIRSWSFRNICNEIGWPVAPFFAPPCMEHVFHVTKMENEDEDDELCVANTLYSYRPRPSGVSGEGRPRS